MTDVSDGKRDFFISFNKADRAWATWIAWILEEAGYTVFFQDWDFKGNFVLEMDRAHTQSRRTVAVLSPDYLTSRFTAPEWAARFAQDATSEHDLLIPVRVRPCELEGLLAQVVHVDLVGCGEAAAREKLLRRVEGIRLKPDEPPLFPGEVSHDAVPERPAFPAAAPTGGRVAATEHLAPATSRRAPPAPWLVGGMALAALVVVATVWLLASGGRNVTATGGVAAGGDITNGNITVDGGTKP
jgi:TIR domain